MLLLRLGVSVFLFCPSLLKTETGSVGEGGRENADEWCRFDTGQILDFAQVCAYGTACIVEKS